jgi:DnaK suppressor protein
LIVTSGGREAADRVALEVERQRAEARIADLNRELAAIAETTAEVPDDEHDAEGSTVGYERARVQALLAQAERALADLAAASERLAGGTYGRCEGCGREIPSERLAALPGTRICVDCARIGEAPGRGRRVAGTGGWAAG